MRHHMSGRKLNRTSSHRQALLANLACALVTHEKIVTTLPKAKELRPYIEKAVTLGRQGNLNARRRLIQLLGHQESVAKIIDVLSPRYVARPGGYTRILKSGPRYGDNAPMAIIEFVDRPDSGTPVQPTQ